MPQSPEATSDQFVACFAELDDLRAGNADPHDFHELRAIALCTFLSGGQAASHWQRSRVTGAKV
jgi:hypothetical protein